MSRSSKSKKQQKSNAKATEKGHSQSKSSSIAKTTPVSAYPQSAPEPANETSPQNEDIKSSTLKDEPELQSEVSKDARTAPTSNPDAPQPSSDFSSGNGEMKSETNEQTKEQAKNETMDEPTLKSPESSGPAKLDTVPASGTSISAILTDSQMVENTGKLSAHTPLSPTISPSSAITAPAASPSKHKRKPSVISDSPLQQMNLSETPIYRPKVVSLYEELFSHDSSMPHPPGYWIEFFLLPVNKDELRRVLQAAQPLNDHRHTVQVLVQGAIANLSGSLPADISQNALRILSTVFQVVVQQNPTQCVAILARIERSDRTFDDLTSALLGLLQQKSLETAMEATQFVLDTARASLGTPLSGLFGTKNFFAALMRVIDHQFAAQSVAVDAFAAIGVLTALNTYDDDGAPPVYQQRISDFIDEAMMTKTVALVQRQLQFDTPHPDLEPPASLLARWVSYWSPPPGSSLTIPGSSNEDKGKGDGVLLALYLFIAHNQTFSATFASSPALVTFLETCAPVFDSRAPELHSKAWLSVLALRYLVDNDMLRLADPARATTVRITASKLAIDLSRRAPVSGVLDLAQVGLRAALAARKKSGGSVDWLLVDQFAGLMYQTCSELLRQRIMLPYNWPRLAKFVLGVLKLCEETQLSNTLGKLMSVVVGLALQRDLLDEEDWSFLLLSVVKGPQVFEDVVKKVPTLVQHPAVRAVRAMTAQYELDSAKPDLPTVLKRGNLACGKPLLAEKLRPLSVNEVAVKCAVLAQVKRPNE